MLSPCKLLYAWRKLGGFASWELRVYLYRERVYVRSAGAKRRGKQKLPEIIQRTTSEVSLEDRPDYWSELLSKNYEGKSLVGVSEADFYGRIVAADCASHVISEAEQTRSACIHNAIDARRDKPMVSLFLLSQGTVGVLAGNQSSHLAPGDILISDSEQAYRHELQRRIRMTVVQFPKNHYLQMVGEHRHMNGQVLRPSHAGQRLLSSLVGNYWTEVQTGMSAEQATAMDDAMLTMLSAALGAEGPNTPVTNKLQQVRRFVEAHLSESGLTPTAVADANNMSLRKLQGLFAKEGLTVAGYIRARRLARAAEILSTREHCDRPISEIALDVGVENASQFSQQFRAAYGVTPREFKTSRLWPS